MKIAAIIAAAGIGKRMSVDCPKQYLEIGGRPIICHTLDKFNNARIISEVVVVVEPGREDFFKKEILESYRYPKNWQVAAGGAVRQESVANGLKLIPDNCEIILVHDGVRPFVTPMQIEKAALTALQTGACVVAFPIKETVKRVTDKGFVLETVDREFLWGAQTPQAFKTELLREAMAAAVRDKFIGTDEASLIERLGKKVSILKGMDRNIKITTPADIVLAEAILANEALTY